MIMPQVKFIRLDTENFFGLFPTVPRVPGSMEKEATEYGMIHVPKRGWDPCAIVDDVPYAVFNQDARIPKWNGIKFHSPNVSELTV